MYVTTRAVVWIEIFPDFAICIGQGVTTRAVVWIEITKALVARIASACHHPCGGVD